MTESACKEVLHGINLPCYVKFERDFRISASQPKDRDRVLRLIHNTRSSLKNSAGTFSPGNRRVTVTRNRSAETWVARLWAVLPIGHAGTERPTGHQEKENDSSLNAAVVSTEASTIAGSIARLLPPALSGLISTRCSWVRRQARCGFDSRQQLSANYGFLFLSTVKGCPRRTGPCLVDPLCSWGVLLVSYLSISFKLALALYQYMNSTVQGLRSDI